MELETSENTKSPEVTDAERLKAGSRHITLEPIHHIEPEHISSKEFVGNTIERPLDTIPSEREDTSTYLQTVKTTIAGIRTKPYYRNTTIVVIATFCVVVGVICYLIFR